MDYLLVEGVRPYDGRYELDLGAELTTREWGWIKRLAGYLPITIDDKSFGDPELICVLTAIAIRRAGRVEAREVPELFERLVDAPFGATITIETGPVEEEATDSSPPPPSSNGNSDASGLSSLTSSETSGPSPRPSGTPDSVTSESSPAASVS